MSSTSGFARSKQAAMGNMIDTDRTLHMIIPNSLVSLLLGCHAGADRREKTVTKLITDRGVQIKYDSQRDVLRRVKMTGPTVGLIGAVRILLSAAHLARADIEVYNREKRPIPGTTLSTVALRSLIPTSRPDCRVAPHEIVDATALPLARFVI